MIRQYNFIIILIIFTFPSLLHSKAYKEISTNQCMWIEYQIVSTVTSNAYYNTGYWTSYSGFDPIPIIKQAVSGTNHPSGITLYTLRVNIYRMHNNEWIFVTAVDTSNLRYYSEAGLNALKEYASPPGNRPTELALLNPSGWCEDSCSNKAGQINYKLQTYNESSPPSPNLSCYEGCQTSPEILWDDCINGGCVASIKYTYTGQSCNGETEVDNLMPGPAPDRCTDQLEAKIAQCGGSMNVMSFDFETCTGVCAPDPCHDKWNELVTRCGGLMAVSNWDASTCSGSCAADPVPDIQTPESEAVPVNIKSDKTTNPDGTSQVTQSTTYNVDGTTYTNTTTTTYDSENNITGTSVSTSSSPQENLEPSYPVPESWYTPVYNISEGLVNALEYQQVFDAIGSFQETILFQAPNLILDAVKLVSGSTCVFPPVISIDLFGRFSSKNVTIDLSQVDTIVDIMKFFFSIMIIICTGRLIMQIFD